MRWIALAAILLLPAPAKAADPGCRGGDVQLAAAGAVVGDVLAQLAATHGVALRGPLPAAPAPAQLQGDLVEIFGRLLRGANYVIVCTAGRPARIVIVGTPPAADTPALDIAAAVAPRWTSRDD